MLRITRLIAAALALSPIVLAQNACKAKETEIQSDGDVSVFESCTTIEGNVVVGEEVKSFVLPTRVQRIRGDLRIEGASDLLTIEGQSLTTIDGAFFLRELTVLNSMNLPQLNSVGEIDWITLPALQSIQAQITEADSVKISDTNLLSLEGINLRKTGNFDINNNKFLRTVDVQLVNVTETLSVTFNKPGVAASFPNLQNAKNITFRDAGSVSLPSLRKVENSIVFVNNSIAEIFLPNLTEVTRGFISFYSNKNLVNISAPLLEKVGGTFQIANNTKFEDLDGFPKLAEVGGAVDLAGRFKSGGLPALEDVRGGFNLQSTEDFDCTEFNTMEEDQVIKGDEYTCLSSLDEALTKDGDKAGSGNGGGKDEDKSGAGQIGISIMTMVGVTFGAVAFLL